MGGLYKDTNFKELQDDERLEKHGPFNSYEEAKNVKDVNGMYNCINRLRGSIFLLYIVT